jgi:DNA adenine methylase
VSAALKAPFPYFGGKSRVAAEVWARFGDAQNYVEPFFGSGAVLLSRPHDPGTETVNDLNGWLTNFWRAIQADPEGVAAWTDYPVSELDLHARGDWLFYGAEATAFVEQMRSDPDYCDVKRAGWWVWGQCAWIGSGWGPRERGTMKRQIPDMSPGRGVNRKLPHLGDPGRGEALLSYFVELSDRLRRVRICCGDWARVTGPSVTTRHGLTGIFLDPPYGTEGRTSDLYTGHDDGAVAVEVRAWALEAGTDPLARIALCGYDGEHDLPGWECVEWKAPGGFGSQGDGAGRENCERERIWFSPHCLKLDRPKPQMLFAEVPPALEEVR